MLMYFLGLITLPALYLLLVFAVRVPGFVEDKFGIAFELKSYRNLDRISDYTLRHDIWWEHGIGPFFTGGWYREYPEVKFSRWIGIGGQEGPCLMAFKIRKLDSNDE